MRNDIIIRPETQKDYKDIVSLVLRSFKEGTDYSDGTDIVALIEEIRYSEYYIPELSFVAELDGKIVGHFLFSKFPLSPTKEGGHGGGKDTEISSNSCDFTIHGVHHTTYCTILHDFKKYASRHLEKIRKNS